MEVILFIAFWITGGGFTAMLVMDQARKQGSAISTEKLPRFIVGCMMIWPGVLLYLALGFKQ